LAKPWERQPGEPREWYRRFRLFLSIGPGRSVEEAFWRWIGERDRPVDPVWLEMARNWQWFERAARWDAEGAPLEEEEFDGTEVVAQARRLLVLIAQEIDRLMECANARPLNDDEIKRMGQLVNLIVALRDFAAFR